MTFKAIVKKISEINTTEDLNEICGIIDKSFSAEKISWQEHEMLYSIISLIKI